MPTPHLAPALGPLVSELRLWLTATAAQFRARHQFAALPRTTVAQLIAADVAAATSTIATTAAAAEAQDIEAASALEQVLADGRVTSAEIPTVRRALSLVRRSATTDHAIATSATSHPAV